MNIENAKGLLEALNGDARNAMHSILGFLELVAEGQLDPSQREYIEACRAAADRHFRGIEDMGIALGLGPQERTVIVHFSPGDLLSQVANAAGAIASRRGITLILNVDRNVPAVVKADLDCVGDALLRMLEAVLSALSNDAADDDVQLNLRASPALEAGNLIFEIMAPARMLSPVSMHALQQDDFEFDASLLGGGALGLVAARKLATALGGHVEASASAAGTRIEVTFRAEAPSLVLSPLPPSGAEISVTERAFSEPALEVQRGLRILVAEDSEDSFQLFRAFLRGQPYSVERAGNGEEAVELASTGTFDIVFMDICMPLMDGYAATRRIRELETGKNRARIPIVVLSAEDLRAQRRQGGLAGCSGHLSKPLRKHQLLEAIRTYSSQSASTLVC
jgi:CheY-like chemotaxis protein